MDGEPTPTPIATSWAEVSRALRTAFGFAQEDWAAWLDVSRKTVQRWEGGEGAPTDRIEQRLLAFCTEKDVFGRVARGTLDIGVNSTEELLGTLTAARAQRIIPKAKRRSDADARGEGEPTIAHGSEQLRAAPIGRVAEIATVEDLMTSHRLVTIVGPGGVGKTTLALAATPPGTVVVRLDTIRDPDLVLGVIATTLAVTARGGSVRARLIRHLSDHRFLVVVDNFEHLLVATPIIADLLASCSGLRILATSRSPLHLSDECVFALEPLACTSPESDAVSMFLTRALAADPALLHGAIQRQTIQTICSRLDGLPLAIELAAAMLRYLSLDDLAHRLDKALRVPTSAARNSRRRHHSMDAAIGWSVGLLTPGQRRLFNNLGAFVDGATMAAIEYLVHDTALDDLAALTDQSLVRRDGSRYRMLETVRDYAVRAVPGSPADEVSTAEPFFRWAIAFARQRSTAGEISDGQASLSAIAGEYQNLRAALFGLLDIADPRAVGLALSLCTFWDTRSMLHEARRALELAGATPRTDPAVAASVRVWIGYFAAHQGDLRTASRAAREALQYFDAVGIDAGVGYARMVLGFVAAEEERNGDAAIEWEASAHALRSAGDFWGLARPLNNLGELARSEGDLVRARHLHEEALGICRGLADGGSLPAILSALAQLSLDERDIDAAVEAATEALDVATRLENVIGQATSLEALARAEYETGDVQAAAGRWGHASQLRESIGLPVEARDRDRYERQIAEAQGRLGDAFTVAWERGRVRVQAVDGSEI